MPLALLPTRPGMRKGAKKQLAQSPWVHRVISRLKAEKNQKKRSSGQDHCIAQPVRDKESPNDDFHLHNDVMDFELVRKHHDGDTQPMVMACLGLPNTKTTSIHHRCRCLATLMEWKLWQWITPPAWGLFSACRAGEVDGPSHQSLARGEHGSHLTGRLGGALQAGVSA